MKISELFGQGRPVFSFEFFPPKTEEGARNLMNTVADLKEAHAPDFVSVTYGAGGSTRERTLGVVASIQRELGLTAMAHLTCVGSGPDELRGIAKRLAASGVMNVLALRGDPPKDADYVHPPDGFHYASQLIRFLRAENEDFDIGAACYPEKHLESPDRAQDLLRTKEKVDLGAKFLISQLFFDNAHYFRFVEHARAAGIEMPILPGIMPITNVAQIERFTQMCGATIPQHLLERLRRVQDDPALVMATGIEQAIRQCRDLLARGAPGIHFYTLNKSYATRCILAAIRG